MCGGASILSSWIRLLLPHFPIHIGSMELLQETILSSLVSSFPASIHTRFERVLLTGGAGSYGLTMTKEMEVDIDLWFEVVVCSN